MRHGLPYMGSKNDIVQSIALNFPKAENFYDLFGGGFAVSHYMIANKSHWYKKFNYNEINSDVVELVKKAINGDFNYNKFKPEWISREDFYARKDTDAYARLLWSFGNNQKNYLFSRDIEQYKKSLHMAVVFDDFSQGADKILKMEAWPREVKTITQKRLYVAQKITYLKKGKQSNQDIQLQQLQQLERLERLEQLERLCISSLSYEQVEIRSNSVVYCDIPYKGTSDYISSFNHEQFYQWALSRPFPVYISEYQMPDEFKVVYAIERKTKLSNKGMTSHYDEKLFWNGVTL